MSSRVLTKEGKKGTACFEACHQVFTTVFSLVSHLIFFSSQINRFSPPLRRPSFCVRKLQHPYLFCFPGHGNNHQNVWQTEADLYLFWQASENYIRTLQASPGDANSQFCCEICGTPEGVKKMKKTKQSLSINYLTFPIFSIFVLNRSL